MSLTVSQGEGLTVLSIASNPNSKWPVLCQILGALCYSPVCSVSQVMRGKLTDVHTALGIVQMVVGIINIVVGVLFLCAGLYFNMDMMAQAPFWLGSMFLLFGIVCVLAAKFPTSCLLVIGMIVNIAGVGLAITAVVLYSMDITNDYNDNCEGYNSYNYYSSYDRYRTPTAEEKMAVEMCEQYKDISKIIRIGLDIMMIVLSVLQLCVTISFCVLTGKALCKKPEDEKLVEDHKPLLEDNIACIA